jgi:large subunit ribosomal protein L1
MGKTKTAFIGEEESKNKLKHQKAHQKDEGKVHVSGLKGGQRVKVVEASPIENTRQEETGSPEGSTSTKQTNKVKEKIRSKKYREAKAKIEAGKSYPVDAAIKLVKESSFSKFDGTMELHLTVKKVGISAQVAMPFSAGREKKVEIATDETIAKIKEGKIDFDILVATPDMMPKLVPFAKVLGPKGLMPNPKNGTLVADSKKVKSFSAGSLVLKTEKSAPLIHVVVGKNSQKDAEIKANIEAVVKSLGGGKQVVRAFITSTMSPSVKLQLN